MKKKRFEQKNFKLLNNKSNNKPYSVMNRKEEEEIVIMVEKDNCKREAI